MSGQLPKMLPSYGGQESDCISRLRDIPAEDDRTPHRHVLVDGVCQSSVVEEVGTPPQECSAICNLMFAAEPQHVLPAAKRRGGQFRRRGADLLYKEPSVPQRLSPSLRRQSRALKKRTRGAIRRRRDLV